MASDSEDQIEYQSLELSTHQSHPLLTRESSPDDDEDDSEVNFNEEQQFMVHMSPDANKCKFFVICSLEEGDRAWPVPNALSLCHSIWEDPAFKHVLNIDISVVRDPN